MSPQDPLDPYRYRRYSFEDPDDQPSLPREVEEVSGPPHPGFGWSLLWCIAFLFATQIPGAIVLVVILIIGPLAFPDRFSLDDLSSPKKMIHSELFQIAAIPAFLITQLLVIGFSLLVIRLAVGRDWPRQLAVRRPSVTHLFLVLVAVLPLSFLADGSYSVFKHLFGLLFDLRRIPGIEAMEDMVGVFSIWPWPLAVLIVGFGPGIGEELWCRGFLGRGLVGRHGWMVGILFTSFFFGLIHLHPIQGPMAMLMGLAIHYIYLTTRSLWMPILLHTLNNSLAVILPRYPRLVQAFGKPEEVPLYVYLASALLFGVIGWALWTSRARLLSAGDSWEPPYPGVAYPPPESDTFVIHPRLPLRETALVLVATGTFIFALLAAMRGAGAG